MEIIAFNLQINDLVIGIAKFSFNLLVLHYKYFSLHQISYETQLLPVCITPFPI